MRVGGDVELLEGKSHLHKSILVVIPISMRIVHGSDATSPTRDDPGSLAEVSRALFHVMHCLLMSVAANVEVDPHRIEELGPGHRGRSLVNVVACRVVADHKLPFSIRCMKPCLQPVEIVFPQLFEPCLAFRLRMRSCRSTICPITWVHVQLAVGARIACVAAEVVAFISSSCGVVNIAVNEKKVGLEVGVLHSAAPVLTRHHPLGIVPSEKYLLVPSFDVANTAVVMIAKDAPPLEVLQFLAIHGLPDLLELWTCVTFVLQATVVIETTGVEIVPDIYNEPRRAFVLDQLFLTCKHPLAHQPLGNAINCMICCTPIFVGHRAGLTFISAIGAANAHVRFSVWEANVVLIPPTHTAPVTNCEKAGDRLVKADCRPLNSIVHLRVRGLAWFRTSRVESAAVEFAEYVRTRGVFVKGVNSRAGFADGLD
mmetsp:Transcript_46419/g.92109  ORF Transcript_46419/g.92109 Transcript_46419/m.92109 type:complete len:427 (+) Transcript_46419:468-1748(+)